MTEAESTTTEQNTGETHEHEHGHEPRPLGECEREISVNIPADTVSRELESLVVRYQKMARVPGFRRGKLASATGLCPIFTDVDLEVLIQLCNFPEKAVIWGRFER